MAKLSVCIIIPAYNEGKVIKSVVKNIQSFPKASLYKLTVLVVDDHSSDATGVEATLAKAIVVRHLLNTGAGGATATGLTYAQKNKFDIAVTMDADGQHLPIDVFAGVEELQRRGLDLLVGSRLIDSAGMSGIKVLGNRGLSIITNMLFGTNATDSQSGLRIFSRKAIENLRWKASGYEFCSEMLWRAKQASLYTGEFPIKAVYTEYSTSKGQNNWNGVNIVKNLFIRRLGEILQ